MLRRAPPVAVALTSEKALKWGGRNCLPSGLLAQNAYPANAIITNCSKKQGNRDSKLFHFVRVWHEPTQTGKHTRSALNLVFQRELSRTCGNCAQNMSPAVFVLSCICLCQSPWMRHTWQISWKISSLNCFSKSQIMDTVGGLVTAMPNLQLWTVQ